MSRAGGRGVNQHSRPSWQCVGDGRGADEPRGAAAHRLPNRCQPLPERALQFAAAGGTGKEGCGHPLSNRVGDHLGCH